MQLKTFISNNYFSQADLDQLKEQLEEEQSARSDSQRLIQKAQQEAQSWKQKCESGEGGAGREELEELKRKLNAKLQDAESQLESALQKAASLEKANQRMRAELEDVTIELERVSSDYLKLFAN